MPGNAWCVETTRPADTRNPILSPSAGDPSGVWPAARDYVAEHSAGVKYGAFAVLFLHVTALGAALGLRGIHQVG